MPVRLHSACLTGDVFGSLRCDCGDQLRAAVAAIAEAGDEAGVDVGVGRQRQVRAMLLDRGERQQGDGRTGVQRRRLGAGEIGPVADGPDHGAMVCRRRDPVKRGPGGALCGRIVAAVTLTRPGGPPPGCAGGPRPSPRDETP